MKLLLLAETALWLGGLAYVIREDERRDRSRRVTAAWKAHFKDNVASGWLFYDGLGQ